ncbi:MAG TPA: hypothetical protein VKP65_07435, partial [Rhodothermales bacterium]|nr:hypothetical protein [Rhodothermales bacterium]
FRDTLDLLQPQPYVLRSFILPGTEQIYLDGTRLDSTRYRIDYRFGRLWIDGLVPDPRRSLVAVYRTWGFAFKDAYRLRSVVRPDNDSTGTSVAVVEERDQESDEPFDPFGGARLERSGSISRGVLVGNNRDATVESGLRMQVAGEVTDGVRVQAVLTDENTPILPEGTTQRLSEFDRVFIEIESEQGTAQLGDFDLRFRDSEFARFSRKLQGITVFGALPDPQVGAVGPGKVAVAGATARGIFQSQDIQPVDGVQGPYRLEGRSGERFIIVIPGSEDVYLDGVTLTRGESNDYVIDYATGELTFTSNRIIRQDDRITVEFQYTTTEFTRTLLGSDAEVGLWQRADGSPRGRLGFTFLREADSRQFNEEFGLSEEDEDLLAVIGDSTATIDGSTRVDFDPEAPFVQYVRQDTTLASGDTTSIFVAITEAPVSGAPVYRVRFSRVGSGQGSYSREGQTVNGILYVFRGPGLGDYEPVRLLPKPKQQRLLDFRGGFEPVRGLELFGEWGHSLNDENRFSDVDFEDDVGDAYLGGLRLKPLALTFGDTDWGTLSGEVRRRFTGNNFASFDRTRPVEFARRWNLNSQVTGSGGGTVQIGDETTDEGQILWTATPTSNLQAEVGRIKLQDTFTGTRQAGHLRFAEGTYPRLSYQVENIHSEDTAAQIDGRWLRQKGRIEQPLFGGKLVPNVEVEQERRRQQVIGTDSLAAASLAFIEYRPGLAWRTNTVEIGGTLEYRTEDQWADGSLQDAGESWTLQSQFRFRPGSILNTDGSIGYRVRSFSPFFIGRGQQDNKSVVLRWNGRFLPFERSVNLNWFYEALTEQTPKLQEIYVRTGAELGEYVWEDANGDGVIQIEEFIPERTQDEGTYVRTFIPSDSLFSTISVQSRVSLQLEPGRNWKQAEARWKRLLSNVSTRTSVQIQEKSKDPNLARIYLLRQQYYRDPTNTLRGLLRFTQDLTLFRNVTRYGLDLSYNLIRNLSVLAADTESRFVNEWRGEATFRPNAKWGVRLLSALQENRTVSENFDSREFDIDGFSVEPELSFNPLRTLQLSSSVSYGEKRDAVRDLQATVIKVPFTARFSLARLLSLTGRVEMADVSLNGDAVGLANFELTDGRGGGTSFLWTLTGWYQISSLLRATLSYNGRAPADAPTLHTVRLQLSAVF